MPDLLHSPPSLQGGLTATRSSTTRALWSAHLHLQQSCAGSPARGSQPAQALQSRQTRSLPKPPRAGIASPAHPSIHPAWSSTRMSRERACHSPAFNNVVCNAHSTPWEQVTNAEPGPPCEQRPFGKGREHHATSNGENWQAVLAGSLHPPGGSDRGHPPHSQTPHLSCTAGYQQGFSLLGRQLCKASGHHLQSFPSSYSEIPYKSASSFPAPERGQP